MLTVFFNHLGGRIPKVDARNRPIAGDSPWKQEIFRAAKFPFKNQKQCASDGSTGGIFQGEEGFCARKSIHYIRLGQSSGSERA
jgi:hypothetical protein